MLATPELLDAIPQKRGADIAFDVLPRLLGRIAPDTRSLNLLSISAPLRTRLSPEILAWN